MPSLKDRRGPWPSYNYDAAVRNGMQPDPVSGHWYSRVPDGDEEGLLLKHPRHPTFNMTVEHEPAQVRFYRNRQTNRLYSTEGDVPVGAQEIDRDRLLAKHRRTWGDQ